MVLSNQHLWELRDCLECSLEKFTAQCNSASSATGGGAQGGAQGQDPAMQPGFFMIENVLYPDLRDARSQEYTDPIVEWSKAAAAESKAEAQSALEDMDFSSGLGALHALSAAPGTDGAHGTQPAPSILRATARGMDLKLNELTIRLNEPYVYWHHGNCEHQFVFSDIQSIRPTQLEPSSFPIKTMACRQRGAKCQICNLLYAEFVTINDTQLPHNPCRFCKSCFDPLHKNKDGTDKREYKRYPWVQDA